jgi:hypothetical protein
MHVFRHILTEQTIGVRPNFLELLCPTRIDRTRLLYLLCFLLARNGSGSAYGGKGSFFLEVDIHGVANILHSHRYLDR